MYQALISRRVIPEEIMLPEEEESGTTERSAAEIYTISNVYYGEPLAEDVPRMLIYVNEMTLHPGGCQCHRQRKSC
ncbi:MAG: hypothetical protein GQ578_00055 [Desulfuromonadaceae bacterium]|nr:hypothetical protein [Desulfuromonadaceae bacterium]